MERVRESSSKRNGSTNNGQMITSHRRHRPFTKGSLSWLELRVFYVRLSKFEADDSTAKYLTLCLSRVPLNPDTLLELNGVKTTIYSNAATTILRRDRLDKISEEAIFVSTDSIRLTGSVKFDVFNKDYLLLSGVLQLCESNGSCQKWNMNCEKAITSSTGFLKAKQFFSPDSASPTVEVFVAGSLLGNPIILTRILQLSLCKKQMKAMLDSIPDYEATEGLKEATILQIPDSSNHHHKPESEEYNSCVHSRMDCFDGEEDGEGLSWFGAGVRVGVGLGLSSIFVGIGIGVGLLVCTFQGTTRNFQR